MIRERVLFLKPDGTRIEGVRVIMGTAKLQSGRFEVLIPNNGFSNWYNVMITPDSGTADYMYSVEFHSNRKFVIHSSNAEDVKEIRWLAIGY